MPSPDTRISIGLEQGADGFLWAHPLGMAGCAAAGITAQAAVAAFDRGATLFRVHDVRSHVEALAAAAAVERGTVRA